MGLITETGSAEDVPCLCRSILNCGSVDEPMKFCPDCWVTRALRDGICTPLLVTAIGAGASRVQVVGSCMTVLGGTYALLILRRELVANEEPVSSGTNEHRSPMAADDDPLRLVLLAARNLTGAHYAALIRFDPEDSSTTYWAQDGDRPVSATPAHIRMALQGRKLQAGGKPMMLPIPTRDDTASTLLVLYGSADAGGGNERLLRTLADLAGALLDGSQRAQRTNATSIRAERAMLAAELHDGLAQVLGALSQRLKLATWLLTRNNDFAAGSAHLSKAVELSERAHRELRVSLGELRLPGSGGDLREDLREYLDDFRRQTGFTCDLQVPEHPRPIPPGVGLHILRIVQEAMVNAQKHSGGTAVSVKWTYRDTVHTFTIVDNGSGLPRQPTRGGYGVTIMGERASRIHGTLTMNSRPGSGCRVILTVPDVAEGGLVCEADPCVAGR